MSEPTDQDRDLVSQAISSQGNSSDNEGDPQTPNKDEGTKPLKQKRADEEIDKAEKLESKSLEERKKELEDLEKRIDKKRADLRKVISEAEQHGKSQTTAVDRAEEQKRAANEYMKEIGVKPYPELD